MKVYDANRTFIGYVPRRKGVQWQDAHNDCGAGSMLVHLDDQVLTTYPTIGNDFNIVTYSLNGAEFFAWIIEGRRRVKLGSGEGADRWMQLSGRGVLAMLGRARVYPELALRSNSSDERNFTFASQDGGWRITSEWGSPVGIRQDSASSIRKGFPVNWPDPSAQWIWPTSPQSSTPPGMAYFRGSFVLPADQRVKVWAAGDERLNLYLDGELILGVSRGGWQTLSAYSVDLAAGYHLLAARVEALQFNGANNPAGFLCSVATVTRNGIAIDWIKRTTPTSFICRADLGSPPGWFPATIVQHLVVEAQARTPAIPGFSSITFGFDTVNDSSASAWTTRRDEVFMVGTDSYLDVLAKLTERDIDVHMTPTLRLDLWKERGTDRSVGASAVRLLPGRDLTEAEAESNAASICSRMLIRHRGGWVEVIDTSAQSTYGRIEGATVAGTDTSDVHAIHVAQAALNDVDSPDVTLPIGGTSEKGPQPYTAAGGAFDVADTVQAPGWSGALAKGRVMTISGAEDDATGVISYSYELYPA